MRLFHHPISSSSSWCCQKHSLVALLVLLGAVVTSCEAFQTPAVLSSRPTSYRNAKASLWQRCSSNTDVDNPFSEDDNCSLGSRRRFLSTTTAALLGTAASSLPPVLPAHAGGLIQFPCDRPLKNRYHFMRAGRSELEADDIYSTNPLFLTNRENQMDTSTHQNRDLIVQACDQLVQSGNPPTVAYHSLAANGIDTADLVCQTLKMGRDRVLPEFTYLDQRAVGLWDSGSLSEIQPAIWALDVMEAGREGTGGRPPPTEDGTPNETLADQFVRLRQFLSLQESRTSGENILIIFPDGTGPALLSAMIAGIPYKDCHVLHMEPGSLRMEVTKESILELYNLRKDDPTYLATIEQGKETLAKLRQQTSRGETMVNRKSQRDDQEREALDAAFEKSKDQAREREESRRATLQAELEQRQARDEAARQKRLAAKMEADRQKELRQLQRQSSPNGGDATAATATDNGGSSTDSTSNSAVVAAAGLGIAAAGVLAAVGMGGGGESDPAGSPSSNAKTEGPQNDSSTGVGEGVPAFAAELATEFASSNVAVAANGTIAITLPAASTLATKTPTPTQPVSTPLQDTTATPARSTPLSPREVVDSTDTSASSEDPEAVEEELKKLEAAQDAMNLALMEDATSMAARKDPVELEMDHLEQKQNAMNSYFNYEDGGSSDWLQVLAEIRDAPDEDDVDNSNGDDYNVVGDIMEEDDESDNDTTGGKSLKSADL